MKPNNCEKEINALTMAGLLHDIGKVLHRKSQSTYYKSHHQTSSDFLEAHRSQLENSNLYDLGLVQFLVRYHHKVKERTNREAILGDPYFAKNDAHDGNRAWNLLKLLKRADEYSCKERDIEVQDPRKGNKRLAPLDSIFSKICIDPQLPRRKQISRYRLTPANPLDSTPTAFDFLSQNEIESCVQRFTTRLPDLSSATSLEDVLVPLQNHILDCLWAVPSDTRYEHSDVSLYDHLRTTAAIAYCLYRRHQSNIGQKSNCKRYKEFYFIGGDFAGIQNYIFGVTNIGAGGAAKRLRARSMFISMFCEATIHKILHALKLPLVCNLFSAGGKFLLLAPCIDEIEKCLQQVKLEIEYEIHKTYFSRFAFLMHWMEIERFKKELNIIKFYDTVNRIFEQLENEKISKHALVLKKDDEWNPDAFQGNNLYAEYRGSGDCKICGKGAAQWPDSPTESELVQCRFCHQDKAVIGVKVPKCSGIAFVKSDAIKEANQSHIVLYHHLPCYSAKLMDAHDSVTDEDTYLTCRFGRVEKGQSEGKFWHRYYANYVPLSNGDIRTFEEIAAFPYQQDESSAHARQIRGMLGVLKVDVDNLGLIFSKGFEEPADDERSIPEHERKTISRLLTLSRMMDLFFTGWIRDTLLPENQEKIQRDLGEMFSINQSRWKQYLKDTINFSMIYTVYAGGDDMVLIGPWETMIIFSVYMQKYFNTFTTDNPSITLSAGLVFVKPRFPAAYAIDLADEYLNASKESGKNRFTLFGRSVKWERLPEIINLFLFLNDKLDDKDSKINTAFLHRLLGYHRLAMRYIDDKDMYGLKYLSTLSYDIGRNIVTRDKAGKIVNGQEEMKVLHPLLSEKPGHEAFICDLTIPVSWVLYHKRFSL